MGGCIGGGGMGGGGGGTTVPLKDQYGPKKVFHFLLKL